MANSESAFSIDDARTTSDNLTVFKQVLEALDAPLGAALAPHLSGLAAGQSLDKPAIWSALYAAIETETGTDENSTQDDASGTAA